MRRPVLAAAALTLLFAGCQRKAETPPSAAPATETAPAAPATPAVSAPDGFQHDANFDAQGFYMPTTPIQVGDLKLMHIAFGAPSDFKQWEAGERASVFGPILMEFEDQTSPVATNEMGQEVHAVTVRVLPTAYRVFPGAISFKGTDPKLGEISFVGGMDPAALAASSAAGPGDNSIVLTGSLQIGDTRVPNAKFTHFMGD